MMLRHLKEDANRLISKGKTEKAIAKLQEAVQLDPSDSQLRLRLAECFKKVGQDDAALKSLVQAADLLKKQGHFARAAAALKRALDLAPGHPTLLQSLRELESQKLLSNVSNSGVISGVLPGAFHGYGGVAPETSLPAFSNSRALELDTEMPLEDIVLEQGGPVVLGSEELEEIDVAEVHPVPAVEPLYPLIRRMGDKALAIKVSPRSRWIVVQSQSPLRVTFADPVSPAPTEAPDLLSGEPLSDELITRLRKTS